MNFDSSVLSRRYRFELEVEVVDAIDLSGGDASASVAASAAAWAAYAALPAGGSGNRRCESLRGALAQIGRLNQ